MRKMSTMVAAVVACLVVPAPAVAAAGPAQAGRPPATVRSALPTCTPQSAIDRLVAYIRTQQQPDGSFPGIGETATAEAVYALVASGVDPSTVTTGGKSAVDWIYSRAGASISTGAAAKFLLALVLAGRPTTAPGGFDFEARVRDAYDPATGLYDADPTANIYSIIALRAAHQPVPGNATRALAGQQQPDGGWSAYIPARETDTNTTAAAMVALVAARRPAPIPAASAFLRTQQSTDGGFTFSTVYGTASDANSTGLVIVALLATGQSLADWERGGTDPVERLLQLQNPSGAFRYNDATPADNAYATYQAGQAAGLTRC
ncbi:prenyltransferase/squalene oxidase repeat-containing protein [Symbioplanes lichenis]|uniref:prenyltransferase/squalene oxidase repeat-containing protein n=1 Tax=Symbioplanes lichenis TaxID=1629072 RepID=UPI002738B0A9|nr:prenyltransferase/squalene oxidase repeat-containing protein [Actinoplanes lichenis]